MRRGEDDDFGIVGRRGRMNAELRTFCFALIAGFSIQVASSAMPFESLLDLPSTYTNGRVSQLVVIEPGQTVTLMDAEGPGAITHIWMTLGQNIPRQVVLRMYWDGETEPSVEAPISDFFGVGHNRLEPELYFATPCLAVAPENGYNVYMPMPFRERARVTVTNDQTTRLASGGGLYFQADYVRYESLPEDTPYFHAQWRREAPAIRRGPGYTVLQAQGRGFIAGVTHHIRVDDTSDTWFHGGGDTIYLDGKTNPTVLKGIGGEDFVGESWHGSLFSSPYAGCTSLKNGNISLYRFFTESPPQFRDSAWFMIGAMQNEMTSVAYWYQTEPHAKFFTLPDPPLRDPSSTIASGAYDVAFEGDACIPVAVLGPFAGAIDMATPIEGMERIDTNRGMLTNYMLPYGDVIPDETNRAVNWRPAETVLSWLDLDAILKPKMPGPRGVQALPDTIAFVLLRVQSASATTREMRIGHDDAVRIWLNGKPTGDIAPRNGFTLDTASLPLNSGANEILIKAANTWNTNWAAFALALSFNDASGLTFDSARAN